MQHVLDPQLNKAVMATNANFFLDGDHRTASYAGTHTTFPDLKKAAPNKDLIDDTSDATGLLPKGGQRLPQADSTIQRAAV